MFHMPVIPNLFCEPCKW